MYNVHVCVSVCVQTYGRMLQCTCMCVCLCTDIWTHVTMYMYVCLFVYRRKTHVTTNKVNSSFQWGGFLSSSVRLKVLVFFIWLPTATVT